MIKRVVNSIAKTKFFCSQWSTGIGQIYLLQESYLSEEHLWIDLTNPKEERRYARKPEILLEEWREFKKSARIKSGQEPWIVIDKIQKRLRISEPALKRISPCSSAPSAYLAPIGAANKARSLASHAFDG